MIKIIEGNLFSTDAELICHQVNCRGTMGSGVALEVKRRFPHVYKKYKRVASIDCLGMVLNVPINKYHDAYICNMFAQDGYGTNKQYTDVAMLEKCFRTVRNFATMNDYKIAAPYKIGCGLGGADWEEVYSMLKSLFDESDVILELWKI